jgi:hypothetical protein
MPYYIEEPDLIEPDAEDEESPTDFQGISSDLQSDWHVPDTAPKIERIHATESLAVTKVDELLDSKARNWTGWSEYMDMLFILFDIQDYVQGKIPCPNETDDPVGASNWAYNDTYAQMLIITNISTTEKVHTRGCPTAHSMWLNLQSMHDYANQPGMAAHYRTLFHTNVAEGGNIEEHLTKLKFYWSQIDIFGPGDVDHRISEALFKRIIASSLPESWDEFTSQYVPTGRLNAVSEDPRKLIDSQQLISIIVQEAERRLLRKAGTSTCTIFPE